ncbi:hypothetical protein AAFA46_05805 [Oscillospiraceae bacterium WX1]
MLGLYFGSVVSVITTVLVLAVLAFIVVSVVLGEEKTKWGRRILLLVLAGTALSALSATRDAFMMENALIAPESLQSLVCAVAGGIIYLIGIVSVFIRNQKFRRAGFLIISALLIVQVLTVEITRIALM